MAGVSNDVVLPIEVFAAEQCLPALAINVKIDQISQPKPLWRVPRGEIDDEGGNDRDADEEGKELLPAEFFHLSNSIQLHKLRKKHEHPQTAPAGPRRLLCSPCVTFMTPNSSKTVRP